MACSGPLDACQCAIVCHQDICSREWLEVANDGWHAVAAALSRDLDAALVAQISETMSLLLLIDSEDNSVRHTRRCSACTHTKTARAHAHCDRLTLARRGTLVSVLCKTPTGSWGCLRQDLGVVLVPPTGPVLYGGRSSCKLSNIISMPPDPLVSAGHARSQADGGVGAAAFQPNVNSLFFQYGSPGSLEVQSMLETSARDPPNAADVALLCMPLHIVPCTSTSVAMDSTMAAPQFATGQPGSELLTRDDLSTLQEPSFADAFLFDGTDGGSSGWYCGTDGHSSPYAVLSEGCSDNFSMAPCELEIVSEALGWRESSESPSASDDDRSSISTVTCQ